MGYFDDFGMITAESTIQEALEVCTVLNRMLGFDLKVEKSGWGIRIEFQEVAVAFVIISSKCGAHLSLSRGRIQIAPEEIGATSEKKKRF